MEENKNKSLLEKGIDAGKEYAKNKAKRKAGEWFVKVILPKILPIIGGFFLILLAIGVILAAQFVIQGLIDAFLGLLNPPKQVVVGTYSSDFLEAAQQVHDEEMTWEYFQELNQLKGPVSRALDNENKVTCCATYVACALYACGYFTEEEIGWNFHEPETISLLLEGKLVEIEEERKWNKVIETEDPDALMAALQPGDIVFFDKDVFYAANGHNHVDHVQIYAGNGEWYNAGGTIWIQADAPREPFSQYWKDTWRKDYEKMWAFRAKSEPKNPPAERTEEAYEDQLIYVAPDGSYKLNSKTLADDILEQLETQKVNNEVMGFDIDELGNMLDKYIEAEIKTTYPQTNHPKSDMDGMVKIKRALATQGQVTDEEGNGVTSETIDLKYIIYEDFCAMVDSQDESALTCFTINPETLFLCLAVNGNVTIKTKFDGSQVTEGDGMRLYEIDYQKYIQNNITPLNYYIALHLISQDTDFMNEMLEAAMSEGGIELTYVDTSYKSTTQYTYDGKIIYTYPDDLTEEEKQWIKDDGYGSFEPIDYGKVAENYEDTSEFSKIEEYRYRGKLYVTNADTYLTSSSKKVNDKPSTITGGSGGEPKEVVNKKLSDEKIDVTIPNTDPVQLLEVIRKRQLIIEETIKTTTNTITYDVDTKVKQINVEKFLDLIKKYPKVKENFESAPSTIFYFLQQTEKTQRHDMIMKYVLYQLTDLYYGVDADDLNYLSDSFLSVSDGYRETIETKIWYSLLEKGYSEFAVAGIMGNLYQKSNFRSNDLESEYEYLLGFSDQTYTDAINVILKPEKNDKEESEENSEETEVEPETYTRDQFINDQAGYGLALWNSEARKEALYDFAKEQGTGIDDEDMQVKYLVKDIESYQDDSWINAETVEDATKAFYLTFIDPNETDITHIITKAQEFYDTYNGKTRKSFAGFSKGTKLIFNGKLFFPEYKQYSSKYSHVLYGGPRSGGTKTLTSSGCGTFAMSSIVSGLLGMEVDPITYLENLDEYFPGGNYYSYDAGSNPAVFDAGYLNKYYGLKVKWWQGANPSGLQKIAKDLNGQCAAIGYRPGHYIAYLPALDDQGYKFYVVDSIQELTGGYTSDADFRNSSGYYPYTYAIIYY